MFVIAMDVGKNGQGQGALDHESCGSERPAKDRTILLCLNYGQASLLLGASISLLVITFVNPAQSHLAPTVRVEKAGMSFFTPISH